MSIHNFLFFILALLLAACQAIQGALTLDQNPLPTETPVVSLCFFDGYGIGDPFTTYTGPSGPFDNEATGEWVQ